MALLTVLAAAASIFLLASLGKPVESAIDRDGGTRVTLTPRTSDDSQLTPEALSQAEKVIGKRVSGARVDTAGNALTVTVPGQNQPNVENLGRMGRLSIRPVLNSLTASPLQIPGRGRVRAGLRDPDLSEAITREKQLRQSRV